ncbi:MAG: hypothetical protein R6X25_00700 [Candidatus Krumholzibacteriia bacterium]
MKRFHVHAVAACVAMLAAVLTTMVPALVATAAASTAWGPRAGVTIDPDQVHVGFHVDAGELFPDGRFVPNIEVGFGDHVTVVAINPELIYRFPQAVERPWSFYVGGGLGINWVNWDDDLVGHDGSDTDLGLNVLGGMRRRLSSGNSLFLELKLGLADSPDAKFTVGLFL